MFSVGPAAVRRRYSAKRPRTDGGGSYRRSPYPAYKASQQRKRGLITRTPSTYRYVRCTAAGTYIDQNGALAPAGTNGGEYTVTLDGLPNYSEFTALYDQFRITKVEFRFTSTTTSVDLASGTTNLESANVFFHTCVDTDGNGGIGVDDMRQYPTYRMHRLTALDGTNGSVRFVPKPKLIIAPGTNAQMANVRSMWLDCSTASSLEHFGLTWNINRPAGTLANVDVLIDVYAKVWLEFRNVV